MPGEKAAERVTCTVDSWVADVRLNRPEKLNALDSAMFAALVATGEELAADPTVRAVVISGEGRGFCAGLDFASFQAMAGASGSDDGRPEDRRPEDRRPEDRSGVEALGERPTGRITNHGQQAAYVWTSMPVPVIAALHGVALGGGLQIALGADLRIVAPDARLSVLEIRWGLIPDMTGTHMLPRLVGLDVAKELTWTGRVVEGTEAVRLGLATRLADEPRAEALRLARELAANSPAAIRGAKALLNQSWQAGPAEQFIAEERTIRRLIGSADQREAVLAYFEKRPASFADPQ
ncbi:MAG: crotonase/enoyl-CoA hydratase family protein [Acidimicrobiales bacterium]